MQHVQIIVVLLQQIFFGNFFATVFPIKILTQCKKIIIYKSLMEFFRSRSHMEALDKYGTSTTINMFCTYGSLFVLTFWKDKFSLKLKCAPDKFYQFEYFFKAQKKTHILKKIYGLLINLRKKGIYVWNDKWHFANIPRVHKFRLIL